MSDTRVHAENATYPGPRQRELAFRLDSILVLLQSGEYASRLPMQSEEACTTVPAEAKAPLVSVTDLVG